MYRNLQQNALSGSIPEDIGRLSNLQALYVVIGGVVICCRRVHLVFVGRNLAYNNLTGPIPESIGNMSSLQTAYVALGRSMHLDR